MLRNLWKALITRPRSEPHRQTQQAIDDWNRCREDLKATFPALAGALGKPRDLRWSGCEWSGEVRFARERSSGVLYGFAAVVVRFEAIEGGEMEEVPAVSLPRDATAVFFYRNNRWETEGRTLFNMTPGDAIDRMHVQFEPVDG